ncbi:MAG: hypothetical protein K8R69_00820 [Deltaproteobacteria bacterium]|nr:hypothetical protein [Deltaproteobacteria bacterium]
MIFALGACSGGAGNGNDTNANIEKNQLEKQKAADRQIAEWGAFIGVDAAVAKEELTNAGLVEQVGTNAQLNESQAQAFFELTFARDNSFSQGIDELNHRNQKAIESFNAALFAASKNPQVQPSLPGQQQNKALATDPVQASVDAQFPDKDEVPGLNIGGGASGFGQNVLDEQDELRALRQKAVDDYANMSSQAFKLRNRLLDAAQILGFGLEPATMQELLADPGFLTVRNDFAAPVLFAIFVKKLVGDPDKEGNVSNEGVANAAEINFGAEPLADVSFRIGNRFISYYKFDAAIPSGNSAEISNTITVNTTGGISNQGSPAVPAATPPDARGTFKVIPAEENSFPFKSLILDLDKKK